MNLTIKTSELKNRNYTRYCKYLNHFGFLRRLGTLFKSPRLLEISHFLKEEYDLLPSEVLAASAASFFLLFVPLLLVISQLNTLLAIILPILFAFLGAHRIKSYPINEFNKVQHTLLQYSDLAFQDFLLILNTTHSIFDAMRFIATAGYPIISEKFEAMLYRIYHSGVAPERLLNEFIETLPQGNLRERLVSMIASKFEPNKIQHQLESLAGEKKVEYNTVTRNLESKLILVVGVCLFLPILTALFISFLGYSANFIAVAMVPIFILITTKMRTTVLKSNFELFGETPLINKEGVSAINSDMVEFLNFLIYFANELKLGLPQEVALSKAARSYSGKLSPIIENCRNAVCHWGNGFRASWLSLRTNLRNPQISFLIEIIERMVKKSSLVTGSRLLSIIQQLNENRELIRERESILIAQQFKIKLLVFVMAGILGLISGLTPWLVQLFSFLTSQPTAIEFNPSAALLIWTSLFIMATYAGYFLTKLVRINKPLQYSFWTGLTFFVTCYLTTSIYI
jgi:hypothetical protein